MSLQWWSDADDPERISLSVLLRTRDVTSFRLCFGGRPRFRLTATGVPSAAVFGDTKDDATNVDDVPLLVTDVDVDVDVDVAVKDVDVVNIEADVDVDVDNELGEESGTTVLFLWFAVFAFAFVSVSVLFVVVVVTIVVELYADLEVGVGVVWLLLLLLLLVPFDLFLGGLPGPRLTTGAGGGIDKELDVLCSQLLLDEETPLVSPLPLPLLFLLPFLFALPPLDGDDPEVGLEVEVEVDLREKTPSLCSGPPSLLPVLSRPRLFFVVYVLGLSSVYMTVGVLSRFGLLLL